MAQSDLGPKAFKIQQKTRETTLVAKGSESVLKEHYTVLLSKFTLNIHTGLDKLNF